MTFLRIAGLGALLFLVACGSGDSGAKGPVTPPVPAITYTDPTDASKWRLVRNPQSQDGKLLLDLVGPTGATGRGVTLTLAADATRLAWSTPEGATTRVRNRAFEATSLEKVSGTGGTLKVLVAQKGGTPKACGAPVLTLALDRVQGATAGTVTLAVTEAAFLEGSAARPVAITVELGALSLK